MVNYINAKSFQKIVIKPSQQIWNAPSLAFCTTSKNKEINLNT